MPFPILAALSVTAGIGLLQHRRQKSKPAPLITQLQGQRIDAFDNAPEGAALSTTQNLALSAGLLGMTTVASLGVPWLRLLSLPGLLYLDLHFVRLAQRSWQRKGQVTIAINDAVLTNLLLLTGQLSASALFATFFFASEKLRHTADRQLTRRTRLAGAEESMSAAPEASSIHWQETIDRGALPLLALSMVSAPWLGVQRSAAVLLANFGYDYRMLAPLTSLSYLDVAAAQGIHVRNEQVFDRLRRVDVILVVTNLADRAAALPKDKRGKTHVVQWTPSTSEALSAAIEGYHAQGRCVAYVTAQPQGIVGGAQADILIHCAGMGDALNDDHTGIHVVLTPGTSAQIGQMIGCAEQWVAKQQQNLALALAPSVITLCGVFFLRFGPVTALLVDYGGMGIGVLNAMWPRLTPNPVQIPAPDNA